MNTLKVFVLVTLPFFLAACSGGILSSDKGKDGGPGGSDRGNVPSDWEQPPSDWENPLQCIDLDHDGYGKNCAKGDDCDDSNPLISPEALEECGDGVDNDCNDGADEDCPCKSYETRPCYGGPQGTENIGECKGGVMVCEAGAFGGCRGQITPAEEVCDGKDNDCDGDTDEGSTNACGECGPEPVEICVGPKGMVGDGIDNDCDGEVDEDCFCDGRMLQPCYSGPPITQGKGICHGGLYSCQEDGTWGDCLGEQVPMAEVCGNEIDDDCDGETDEGCGPVPPVCTPQEEVCEDDLDNDCDGDVDEGCGCNGQTEKPCYRGPAERLGEDGQPKGECKLGAQICIRNEFWAQCEGDVLPSAEVCDGLDNDCDGEIDEWSLDGNLCGFCGPAPQEVCNSLDDDCDGRTDEGTTNLCGACGDEPPEICNGEDDNCNGLTDDGALNACGTCDESCYTLEYKDDSGWDQGDEQGVNHDEVPDQVQLNQQTYTFPFIWIANSNDGSVSKLNTDTGAEEGRYRVGQQPSRTAVDRMGNVWVGNRLDGSVTKIALVDCVDTNGNGSIETSSDGNIVPNDECVLFTRQVGSSGDWNARAVAIDADDNVWVGLWVDRQVVKLNGSDGSELLRLSVPGCPYGAAVDDSGNVWVVNNCSWGNSHDPSNESVTQISIANSVVVGSYVAPGNVCMSTYGLTVDGDGDVWIGSYGCGTVLRFRPSNGQWWEIVSPGWGNPRGLAVSSDGFVYVALNNNKVAKIRRSNNAIEKIFEYGNAGDIYCGIGIDSNGRVWAIAYNGVATRINDLDSGQADHFPSGLFRYTYSDMTGYQLRIVTARNGTWRAIYDSGRVEAKWDRLEWDAVVPNGTSVSGRVRVSGDLNTLNAAPWTPSSGVSPVDLKPQNLVGRYVQVEMALASTINGVTPILKKVTIYWQRP